MLNDDPYSNGDYMEIVSAASSAIGKIWGMGALHLGIAALKSVPDGWLKVNGLWIKLDKDDLFCIGLGE